MANIELYILKYVHVSSGQNHYFFSYRVHRHSQITRHTHTHTHTHTDRHTDEDEYIIVALNKPQLQYSAS